MTTNNAINAPLPISAANGGSGVASPTAHGILIAEGASAFTPITLSAGQVLVGTTASDPLAATISGSGNITVTSSTGAIAISATGLAAFTWTDVSGTSASMAVNNGYIADNAGLVTLTLPTTAAVGSQISVQGKGAGGWSIAQNSGQLIHFGSVVTTTTTGSLSSSNQWDSVNLVCVTANTTWAVLGGAQGNLTYV